MGKAGEMRAAGSQMGSLHCKVPRLHKMWSCKTPSWHRAGFFERGNGSGLATAPFSAEVHVLDKILYGRNQFSHDF